MRIELDGITKYYKTPGTDIKRDVLDGISLTINSGDSIAIVGPSGSGKSTLLNIIGTLDEPSSGTVKFNGDEINHLEEKKLAGIRNNNIGFVFQQHHLLPQLNLIENVLLPVIPQKDKIKKDGARERAMEFLESVGLSDKIHQRPGQMSVGECQRAAVVRALINEPGIILADEPTGSLDSDSAEIMGDLLSNINDKRGVALVVVTHSMPLAKKMKVIYKLDQGKLMKI